MPQFPKYKAVEYPLLSELISRGGKSKPTDRDAAGRTVYEALADHFGLSQEARDAVLLEEGKERSEWKNRVRWAVRQLRKAGLLRDSAGDARGYWILTSKARAEVETASVEVDPGRNAHGQRSVSPGELERRLKAQAETGQKGERLVVAMERTRLDAEGRPDLAARVEHVAEKNVACGFDVLSFNGDGSPRHIEVKSTTGDSAYRFEITINELETARLLGDSYWIYRVTLIDSAKPRVFRLQNPAGVWSEDGFNLRPVVFRVEEFEQGKGG